MKITTPSAVLLVFIAFPAIATAQNKIPVNPDNFVRAELLEGLFHCRRQIATLDHRLASRVES